MSKEGNMEELQRWNPMFGDRVSGSNMFEHPGGEWVRFSDVEEREAELQENWRKSDEEATHYSDLLDKAQARIRELKQALDRYIELNAENKARIKELEETVSGKTMFDAAGVVDARWRKRIEVEAKRFKNLAWNARKECSASGDLKADIYRDAYQRVRSLLDSGEEQGCPDDDGVVGALRQSDSALTRLRSVLARVEAVARAIYEAQNANQIGPPPWDDTREFWPATYKHGLSLARAAIAAADSVSQGMVRDGEVVVARADLQVALDWRSDDPEDNYPDVNEAFDRLRSVLAREGGEE